MHKSNRRRSLFGSRTPVMLVATTVYTNYARNAKIGFFTTVGVVGLLVAAVMSSSTHPLVALLIGVVFGSMVGAVVWAVVRIWPVVRIVWWWAAEITVCLLVVWLLGLIGSVPSTALRVALIVTVLGLPVVVGPVRRYVMAWAWCLIVRHRLRVCFTDVIRSNQHGSLPLILLARPTPVGERVWIYLRPGLSKSDLLTRQERLAVVCWAASVVIEQPGSNAAFLRLDIKRRDVLARVVTSPLLDNVTRDPGSSSTQAKSAPSLIPTGLDLDDVALLHTYKPTGKTATPKEPGNGPAARHAADDDDPWI